MICRHIFRYSQAIETLPDNDARIMCMEFAALERKLGEIDRARAIYAHASQVNARTRIRAFVFRCA